MDKCIENNTQMFIKDKSHITKVYVTSFHYLGFHFKGQGHFSMNKSHNLFKIYVINVNWCTTQRLTVELKL